MLVADDIDKFIEQMRIDLGRAMRMATNAEESVRRFQDKDKVFNENLDALRRKILNARQKASSIRVSLNGVDNGVCHRTFRPLVRALSQTRWML